MIIKIENFEGEVITRQQADQLADYVVCYYDDNNILLKEESIWHNKPYSIKYYNVNNEPHQIIFNTHYNHVFDFFSIIDIEIFNGNYKLEKSYRYGNSMHLESRINELFDPNGDTIGREVYWENQASPDYSLTRKYYYDRSQNPDDYWFIAEFNRNTGAFERIFFPELHIDDWGEARFGFDNSPQDIQALRTLTGISQELAEYYTVPEVIPNF